MNSIKRLIAAIICLSMIIGCVLVQAEEAETETIVYGSHTLGLINALEIAEYTEENLSNNITRGEFYALLAKANGYPETINDKTIFTDLKAGEPNEGYIKTLYKVGLITTTKDGRIKAGENISATEAAALLVKALGYSPKAEALGGYPAGYLSIAATLDITDDIAVSGDSMTVGMALELVYNALEADLMIEVPTVSGSKKEYRTEKGVNLITTVFGMEILEGVVDGVDISRVSGENDILPFHMEIAGEELNCEDVAEPFGYLGYYVKLYHKPVRTYGDKIIYIEKTDDNKEQTFDIRDIKNIVAGKMEAYESENGKCKDYRLKKAIPVVYNGVSTNEPFTYDMISGKNGTVKLLDNNGDNVFDIAFAEVYENIIVSYVNKAEKLVYHKYDNTKKLVLDNEIDEPYLIVYDENGVEIQPGLVSLGDVLSVYYSAEDAYQTYIRVYLSKKVISGEIEEIVDEDEITVDGTTYELDPECIKNNGNLIKVGANLTMYLDVKGYIADVVPYAGDSMEYGFLAAAGMEKGLDQVARFKIYTGDEELLEAVAAKNIRIDGVRYNNKDKGLYTNLLAAAAVLYPDYKGAEDDESIGLTASVVRYSLNANGEVTSIDTIMDDSTKVSSRESNHTPKNSLFAVKIAESSMYRKVSNHMVIGQNIPVNNSTVVIGYPDIADGITKIFNTDNYNHYTINEAFAHGDYVEGWAFYTRENQIVSDLVAVPSTEKSVTNIPSSGRFAVVDRVSTMLDPRDAFEIDCLNLVTANGDVKIPVKSGFTFSGGLIEVEEDVNVAALSVDYLKQGDVIRYTLDARGYLKGVTLYYRPSTNEIASKTGYFGNVSSDFSWITGYVYKSYPEGFYLYDTRDAVGKISHNKSVLENITTEDCIFVYHSAYDCLGYSIDMTEARDNHVISSIDVNNVKSYCETGDDCSFVVVQRYSGAPYTVIEIEGIK